MELIVLNNIENGEVVYMYVTQNLAFRNNYNVSNNGKSSVCFKGAADRFVLTNKTVNNKNFLKSAALLFSGVITAFFAKLGINKKEKEVKNPEIQIFDINNYINKTAKKEEIPVVEKIDKLVDEVLSLDEYKNLPETYSIKIKKLNIMRSVYFCDNFVLTKEIIEKDIQDLNNGIDHLSDYLTGLEAWMNMLENFFKTHEKNLEEFGIKREEYSEDDQIKDIFI